MSVFDPSFGDVTSTIKVWSRGDYELKVTGVKGFLYTRERDGAEVAGAQYSLAIAGQIQNDGSLDDEFEDEIVVPTKLYVHSKKGWGFTKGILMAMMGFTEETEDEFNEHISDLSFAIDGEIGDDGRADEVELGGGWNEPVGGRVRVTLSKTMYNEREQQEFKSWRPANA